MSAKRNLYKPVVQADVGLKSKRKPLSQGRLVVSSSGTQLPVGLGTENVAEQSFRGTSTAHSAGFRAREASPQRYGTGSQQLSNELGLSPRRTIPRIPDASLQGVRPNPVLDISDSEDDPMYGSQRVNQPTNVMVLDASRQTIAPDQAEVDIQTGFEKSPSRVVCHSRHLPRESGSLAEACRIAVPAVPKMEHMGDIFDDNNLVAESVSMQVRTPPKHTSAPEKTIAGGQIDKHSFARLEVVDADNSTSSKSAESSAEDGPTTLGSAPMSRSYPFASPAMAVHGIAKDNGDGNADFIAPRVVKEATEPTKGNQQTKMKENVQPKKAFRVVSSRYMDAAASTTKGPIKATTSTAAALPSKPSAPAAVAKSKGKPTMNVLKVKEPKSNQKDYRPVSADHAANTARSSTPDMHSKQLAMTGELATTANDSLFRPLALGNDSINLSVIAPNPHSSAGFIDQSQMGMDPEQLRKTLASTSGGNNFSGTQRNQPGLSMSHNTSSLRKKDQQRREVTQMELDLLYTLYLQSVFMTTRARKTLEEKERQAIAQLSALKEYSNRLRRRKQDLDKELIRQQHLGMLDDMLDIQEPGLAQASVLMGQYEQQHAQLATAMQATRHQVATAGIVLPDRQEDFDAAMSRTLQESEYLLGEISAMAQQQVPHVSALSKQVEALTGSVDTGASQLAKCDQLLTAVNSLVTHEVSLKVQQIQLAE